MLGNMVLDWPWLYSTKVGVALRMDTLDPGGFWFPQLVDQGTLQRLPPICRAKLSSTSPYSRSPRPLTSVGLTKTTP